ncbi:MAG: ferritin-like domain-containing protein [Alphaproteobacteria bacterium]|nr:ferritin-like domain-containing protein [Alphaproteobacteria bacterium]
MSKHWTLDDIPWDAFDATKVDPDLLRIAKAASMVERNANDYAIYLCNIFHDDSEFQEAARTWAQEEEQHGEALRRWAELADSSFDFKKSFRRFTDGFQIPVESLLSVRGSRTGELISRCVVEVGTSSYYSALADASEEPVLKAICRNIAGDEFRHYKLFYTHMKRYYPKDRLNVLKRLRIALGRIIESEDDELSFAYFCANDEREPYVRKKSSAEYLQRAYRHYRLRHLERAVAMTMKAATIRLSDRNVQRLAKGAHRLLRWRLRRIAA